jgi:hypothetical protein
VLGVHKHVWSGWAQVVVMQRSEDEEGSKEVVVEGRRVVDGLARGVAGLTSNPEVCRSVSLQACRSVG